MAWSLDARIPVTVVREAGLPPGKPAAWLGADAPPGVVASEALPVTAAQHRAACACCAGRSPAAQALDRLFQARARATCPWFDRVLVPQARPRRSWLALRDDTVAAARFRLG
jgi:hypothetical protein